MSLPTTFDLQAAHGKTIKIPSVGYGTWAAGETGWCKDATLAALKAGYRHLDCAWMYGVDEEVGAAIRESGIPRSEIFVTTKFWPHFAAPENVELCLDLILRNMGLDYVDLYLAHWPVALEPVSRAALEKAKAGPNVSKADRGIKTKSGSDDDEINDWTHTSENLASQEGQTGSFVSTWKAMQKLVTRGKTRSVGVSNFSITDIKALLPYSTEIPISCNQVEVHPWLPNNELISFAKEHKILITCYSPFAGQKDDGATLIKDQTVIKIAEKNGMDVGQLLQSWAVQRGTVPLGKSQTESRIKTNLDVKKLSSDDMDALDKLEIVGGKGRTIATGKNTNGKAFGVNMFSN